MGEEGVTAAPLGSTTSLRFPDVWVTPYDRSCLTRSSTAAVWRLARFLSWILLLAPFQMLIIHLSRALENKVAQWFFQRSCRSLGIAIETEGKPLTQGPALIVSNHVSYSDILVLGSMIPGRFVAKAEVARWPFFGALAKLNRTIFIERRRTSVRAHLAFLRPALEEGKILILFPEGTSGDGNRSLPFKSSLLAVAEQPIHERPIPVQPVSLTFSHSDGIPLGRALRPFFAWYGDMPFLSHLWTWLGLGRITVRVRFHTPVTVAEFGSRKALTAHCSRTVAEGVESLIRRRPDPRSASSRSSSDRR